MKNYWLAHQYVREVTGLDPLEFEADLLEDSKKRLGRFKVNISIGNVRWIAYCIFCQVYQIARANRQMVKIDRGRMTAWSMEVAKRQLEQLRGEW